MKLSTGKVAFTVEFDNGDKQNIFFNPNDPNLMIRMKDLQNILGQRLKGFENIQFSQDGQPVEKEIEVIEKFRNMQNIIFEELDRAFNGDISSVVFKHCSPFAIVDGDYFIVQFINAITPEITRHIKKASTEFEEKMAKHTDKYKK